MPSSIEASIKRAGVALGFYFPADGWACAMDLRTWPGEAGSLVCFMAARRSLPADGGGVWFGFHSLPGQDLARWSATADHAADFRAAIVDLDHNLRGDP